MTALAPAPTEIPRIIAAFGRRFPGVTAWWGCSTRSWWALARDGFGRDHLVEAPDPAELARRVEAVIATPRFSAPKAPSVSRGIGFFDGLPQAAPLLGALWR